LPPRVLVVSHSDLSSDPRVDRQIDALRGLYDVVAAGFRPPRYEDVSFVDISIPPPAAGQRALRFARLLARRHEAAYWKHPLTVAALDRLRDVPADVAIANDISTLPVTLRLGMPVLFDAHEYAPGQAGNRWSWHLLYGPHASALCRRYIPRVAAMTTVSTSIADEYLRLTDVRPRVVTNAPRRQALEPTCVHEPVRVLHHGAATPGRGLEEMIRLAGLLDERFMVDFMLVEDAPGYRASLVERARGNPRIRFVAPQPMTSLVETANTYDVGLHLLQPRNPNQRYALPNKLFEFIQARLAVAIGPSPEMARIVERYRCGVVAADFAPETLAAALNGLDADSIGSLKNASHAAADELCAEANVDIVRNAVADALAAGSSDQPTDGTAARASSSS
jgi:hypothetical protein